MPVVEMPNVVAVNPLRIAFTGMRDVLDHCSQLYPEDSVAWRYREYLRASVLAHRKLPQAFMGLTKADHATVRWEEIADDVAELSHLERNPE